MEQAFTTIYDKNKWGGSGTGSKMSRNNQNYIDLLKQVISDYDIHTICDVGCGDWQFSQHIGYDQMDVSYLGIDCVKSVITTLQNTYQSCFKAFLVSITLHKPKAILHNIVNVLQIVFLMLFQI